MDGLTPRLQDKVLEFCAMKDWRLSPNELSVTDPNFEELQKFILTKAQMEQKRAAYMMGKSFHSIGPDENASSQTASRVMTIPPALRSSTDRPSIPSAAASSPDPMAELTSQFKALSLQLATLAKPQSSQVPVSVSPNQPRPMNDRVLRCLWCDSIEHMKNGCSELRLAVQNNQVRYNENGRIANVSTGQEIPLMLGKGGMKVTLNPATGSNAIPLGPINIPSVNTISLEADEPAASLGDNSTVCIATINNDDGTVTYEYVDVEAAEKRRREGKEDAEQRGKRPRTQPVVEIPPRATPPINRPIRMDVDPPAAIPLPTPPTEKYRVISDLQKGFDATKIGTKIREIPVTMT